MIDPEDLPYLSFGDTLRTPDDEVLFRGFTKQDGVMSFMFWDGRIYNLSCSDERFSLTPKTREWIDYLKAKKQKEIEAAI